MAYPAGPSRYRLMRLSDGRIHATDNVDPRRTYLLTPRPATRPTYSLARAGELQVRTGHVVAVSEPAASSGYRVTRDVDDIIRFTRVNNPGWQLAVSPRAGTTAPRGRFAILDLRGGALLLLDVRGVHELAIEPSFAADPGGLRGDPDFELSDDFAP